MDSRNRDGENKSLGSALVDVFDAAVSLVKSELTAIARRAGDLVKAKGLGAVLLLAAAAPLSMALIFLILFIFFGLERLGLGAWAAALLIAIVSFVITGVLALMGIRKLTAEVPEGGRELSEIEKDDLKYGAQGGSKGGDHGKSSAVSDTPDGQETSPGVYRVTPTPPSSSTPGTPHNTTPGNSHRSTQNTAEASAAGLGTSSGELRTPGMPGSQGTSSRTTAPDPQSSAPHSGAHGVSPQSSTTIGGVQGTSTGTAETSGHNAPAGTRRLARSDEGIPVSTDPTYRDDMKKEGY